MKRFQKKLTDNIYLENGTKYINILKYIALVKKRNRIISDFFKTVHTMHQLLCKLKKTIQLPGADPLVESTPVDGAMVTTDDKMDAGGDEDMLPVM